MPASSLGRSVSPRGKLFAPLLHPISASNVSVIASRRPEERRGRRCHLCRIWIGTHGIRHRTSPMVLHWQQQHRPSTAARSHVASSRVRAFGTAIPSFARSSAGKSCEEDRVANRGL